MTSCNPNIFSQFSFNANKIPGFYFRKRVERVDWKRLASVDVRKVASQIDIDALQDNLLSVAFCDIDSEIDTRYADTNLDYLTNTVDSLRRENFNLKKEADLLKKRFEEQEQRLTTTRKECHRRRLLLLAQQRIMNNGPQSYFRCSYCPKAFINGSFLNAHLFRRHAEIASALQNVDLGRSGFLQSSASEASPVKKAPRETNRATLTTNLEDQIKEVLDHIKAQYLLPPPQFQPQPQPVSSAVVQTSPESPEAMWKKRATDLERQLEEERSQIRQYEERNRAWQEAITSQHKVDVERVREMLEVEIRNLREENLKKEREILRFKIKGVNPVGYNDLEDDVPLQLERQVKSLEASPKRGRYNSRNENRIFQMVNNGIFSPKHSIERLRQSTSAEKAASTEPEKSEKSLQVTEPQPSINPLDEIPHYKDRLKDFLANQSAMRRLRTEVESLLEEQLIDHEVEPRAKSLPKSAFSELLGILGQERQHLSRKFPNFEKIRAFLARKVDRLALQALYSKREHANSSPSRGESFKRARPYRVSDRGRPTSGRPSSLTSLAAALSPIAEHRRGATASPTALRRAAGANQTQSKQSLFEDSANEDEENDEDGLKNEKTIKRKRKEGMMGKYPQPLDEFEDDDEDDEEEGGEERLHGKSTSPGPSVKFSHENIYTKDELEDIDYRFVRRKVDDEDDEDDGDNDNYL